MTDTNKSPDETDADNDSNVITIENHDTLFPHHYGYDIHKIGDAFFILVFLSLDEQGDTGFSFLMPGLAFKTGEDASDWLNKENPFDVRVGTPVNVYDQHVENEDKEWEQVAKWTFGVRA
jgi:hypothetical protein